jgi:hypothetical protein
MFWKKTLPPDEKRFRKIEEKLDLIQTQLNIATRNQKALFTLVGKFEEMIGKWREET